MFRIEGLDELLGKLDDLGKRAERLDGEHQVPFNAVFNADFMRRFTDFLSIDEMLRESGFKVESTEDFAAIPDGEWDAFVEQTTLFANWQDMQEKAVGEWAARQLGLDE